MHEPQTTTPSADFDVRAAEQLVAQFRATSDALRVHALARERLAARAAQDWRGAYETKFSARMAVHARDAERLAAEMDAAADGVSELLRLAGAEVPAPASG